MTLLNSELRALVAAQLASGVMAANADQMTPSDAVDLFAGIEKELVRRKWKPGRALTTAEPAA